MPRKTTSLEDELAAAQAKVAELTAKKKERDQRARTAQVSIVGEAVMAELERGKLDDEVATWLRGVIDKLSNRKKTQVAFLLPSAPEDRPETPQEPQSGDMGS